MIKFSHKDNPAIENYWEYCCQHQIPHIEIITKSRVFVTISFDLLSCLPFDKLKGDVVENVIKIYEAYTDFFQLPQKNEYSGGSINLCFVVHKKHSEFIATQLFDYLAEYVKKNKISIDNTQKQ